MDSCLFCQITAGKQECRKVIETSQLVGFHDTNPKAPVHVLIVPKRHVERPEELRVEELEDIFKQSEEVAQILGIKDSGYRLIFNVGSHAGQTIDHVHLHLLGGAPANVLY